MLRTRLAPVCRVQRRVPAHRRRRPGRAGSPPRSRRCAGAQPQPSINQVQAKINTLTGQFNKANQQYDQVEQQLTAAKTRLKQVNKQLARDEAQYEAARKLVVQIAASSYEDSGSTSLAGPAHRNDPRKVLAQASIVLQLTGTQEPGDQGLPRRRHPADLRAAGAAAHRGRASRSSPRSGRTPRTTSLSCSRPEGILSISPRRRAAAGAAGHRQQRRRYHPRATTTARPATQAEKAVAFVFDQLGCPYNYGSTGPCSVGFDCSGLVMSAWAAAGITIPRDTYAQWAALPHISLSRHPARRPGVLQRHRPRSDVRRRRHDHRRAHRRPGSARAAHEHLLVREQLRRRRAAVTLTGRPGRPRSYTVGRHAPHPDRHQ